MMTEDVALGEWIETGVVAFGLWGMFGLMLYGMKWMYRPLLDPSETASVPMKLVPVVENFDYDLNESDIESIMEAFKKLFSSPGNRKGIIRAKTIKSLKDYVALNYDGWGMREMPDGCPIWLKQLEADSGPPGFESPIGSRSGVLILTHTGLRDSQGNSGHLCSAEKSSAVVMLIWMLLFYNNTPKQSLRLRIAGVWNMDMSSMEYSVVLVYDSKALCKLLPVESNNNPVYNQSFECISSESGTVKVYSPRRNMYIDTDPFPLSVPQRIGLVEIHDIICTYKDGDVIVESSTWDLPRISSILGTALTGSQDQ